MSRVTESLQFVNFTGSRYNVHRVGIEGTMHIISREPFNNATKQYPNEATALEAIYKALRRGEFRTPDELKALFPSLDRMKYKEKWWVIDVGGNHLRILFFASFETQKVFIKHIVSHAEYDKLMQHYRRSSS